MRHRAHRTIRVRWVALLALMLLPCAASPVWGQTDPYRTAAPVVPLGPGVQTEANPQVLADPAPPRWWLGLRAHLGSSITGRPEDQPGDPTLLYATGFTGTAWGLGATGAYEFAIPLRIRAELALGRFDVDGYAVANNQRRDLALGWTAIEAIVGLEPVWRLGENWEVNAMAFTGLRSGVQASAVETRTGFRSGDGAPSIQTNAAWLVGLQAGAAWCIATASGTLRLPLAVRWTYNASYPATTRERLNGFASVESPGRYAVDNDFTIVVQTGFDLGW